MDEKAPLISSSENIQERDQECSEGERIVLVSEPVPVPGAFSSLRTVTCQICTEIINVDNKQNQLVVKCTACDEATPIKTAPPGKQYVRCPCNCLLICKASSSRVGCPRANCRRVITLARATVPSGSMQGTAYPPPSYGGITTDIDSRTPVSNLRVSCGNCGSPFIINTPSPSEGSAAARCPHCRRISSIGVGYARTRWIAFAIVAVIFLGAAIGVTAGTRELAQTHPGYYVLWVVFYVLGISSFVRCILYCLMPISAMEVSALNA